MREDPATTARLHRDVLRRSIAERLERLAESPLGRSAEIELLRKDLSWTAAPRFGLCQECGSGIDLPRLLQDPGLRLCGRCGQHYYWEQDESLRFVLRVGTALERRPFPAELVIGRTRWELPALNMTAEDWERHRADLAAHREFRDLLILRPSAVDEVRWISVSGRPVFDGEGRFTGYRGYAREVAI